MNSVNRGIRWLWQSPTLMAWASFGVRSVGMLVVLPLIGRRWSEGDVAYWLLLANTVGILAMVTFGFDLTFSRLVSYARAGLTPESMGDLTDVSRAVRSPDVDAVLARILPTARLVFLTLAGAGVVLSATVGSLVIAPVVQTTSNPSASWMAWAAVALGVGISVFGSFFSAFLVGVQEIARLRRWEAGFGLIQIALLTAAIVLEGGVLGAVCVSQFAGWAAVARNRWLARRVAGGILRKASGVNVDLSVWAAAWPSAWRQGLTQALAHGVMQASGPIFAQISDPGKLASYLLCMRLSQVLQQLAVTPFSSRLPAMAAAKAAGDRNQLIRLATGGMRRAYMVFLVGALAVAWGGNLVFDGFGSRTLRIDGLIWHAFLPSVLLHVWGGMHSGLYNLTNRLFSHVTAVAFAVTYLATAWSLVSRFGALAFPIAAFAAHSVACLHVGRYTYRAVDVAPIAFERATALPALIVMLAYLIGWAAWRAAQS